MDFFYEKIVNNKDFLITCPHRVLRKKSEENNIMFSQETSVNFWKKNKFFLKEFLMKEYLNNNLFTQQSD